MNWFYQKIIHFQVEGYFQNTPGKKKFGQNTSPKNLRKIPPANISSGGGIFEKTAACQSWGWYFSFSGDFTLVKMMKNGQKWSSKNLPKYLPQDFRKIPPPKNIRPGGGRLGGGKKTPIKGKMLENVWGVSIPFLTIDLFLFLELFSWTKSFAFS